MPTLYLAAPYWFDAGIRPWTCLRDNAPQVLETTVSCAVCPHWEARLSRDADRTGPLMLDWFVRFRPPHEVD